jgi:hypothetical protein
MRCLKGGTEYLHVITPSDYELNVCRHIDSYIFTKFVVKLICKMLSIKGEFHENRSRDGHILLKGVK